jgi:hypothetical protein
MPSVMCLVMSGQRAAAQSRTGVTNVRDRSPRSTKIFELGGPVAADDALDAGSIVRKAIGQKQVRLGNRQRVTVNFKPSRALRLNQSKVAKFRKEIWCTFLVHLQVDSVMVVLRHDAQGAELFCPKEVLNRPYSTHVLQPTMTTIES